MKGRTYTRLRHKSPLSCAFSSRFTSRFRSILSLGVFPSPLFAGFGIIGPIPDEPPSFSPSREWAPPGPLRFPAACLARAFLLRRRRLRPLLLVVECVEWPDTDIVSPLPSPSLSCFCRWSISWFAVALGPPGDGFGIVPREFGGLGGWSGADIVVFVCGFGAAVRLVANVGLGDNE